jgi:hypothetical protein
MGKKYAVGETHAAKKNIEVHLVTLTWNSGDGKKG